MNINGIPHILARLQNVRETATGYIACCPAHEDHSPSLSITLTSNRLLFHCFAGCPIEAIMQELGLSLSDLFTENGQRHNAFPERNVLRGSQPAKVKPHRTKRTNYRKTATFPYTDKEGQTIAVKERFDFQEVYSDGSSRPAKHFKVIPTGGSLPIYNLPDVVSAIRQSWQIWITEGEAKADMLNDWNRQEWGIPAVATTNIQRESASLFRNADIIIVPDRDNAGKRYAERIANFLFPYTKSIKLLNIDHLFYTLNIPGEFSS